MHVHMSHINVYRNPKLFMLLNHCQVFTKLSVSVSVCMWQVYELLTQLKIKLINIFSFDSFPYLLTEVICRGVYAPKKY